MLTRGSLARSKVVRICYEDRKKSAGKKDSRISKY